MRKLTPLSAQPSYPRRLPDLEYIERQPARRELEYWLPVWYDGVSQKQLVRMMRKGGRP